MKFYQELSRHYEDIFPRGNSQLSLLKEIVGDAPKRVIDIACGNGGYAIELAKEGHYVLGIDLSMGMVQRAREIAREQNTRLELEFRSCSMLELDEIVNKPFDMGFCIGNSLVHLNSLQEIKEYFRLMYEVALTSNGKLVIQIINYNRILDQDITSLPTIENKNKDLVFERNYLYNANKKKVEFKTTLKVGDQSDENVVDLIPLRKEELVQYMQEAGFKIQGIYGSFDKEAFECDESFYCIIVAEK